MTEKIHFSVIIPLRPKAESANWKSDCYLLQKTIQSVLNQTYNSIEVYIIYTDEPEIKFDHPRVHYHYFPFGYQEYDDIPCREELFVKFKKSKKMVVRRWDKAKKLCFAAKIAKSNGTDYIMALDSDDRISIRLMEFLVSSAQKKEVIGWFINKGYLYRREDHYLVRFPRNLQNFNGSTHILRSDIIQIPDFDSQKWQDYNLFIDHGWVRERIRKQYKQELQAVPFYALLYYVHASNISRVQQFIYGNDLKVMLKRVLYKKKLTDHLKEEFCIGEDDLKGLVISF